MSYSIVRIMGRISVILAAAYSHAGFVVAQTAAPTPLEGDNSFCFPKPTATHFAKPLNLPLDNLTNIQLGWFIDDSSCEAEEVLVPTQVNWHVYTLDSSANDDDTNDNVTPRIAMWPPNMVQPELDGAGILRFRLESLEKNWYRAGDIIEAGVALWLPAESMVAMSVVGGDEGTAEVDILYNGTEPMKIDVSGGDQDVQIQSLQAPVDYNGTGYETRGTIIATAVGGSRLALDGATARIAVPPPPPDKNTTTATTEDRLRVTMSGSYPLALVQGDYEQISISGTGGWVIVKSNESECPNVVATGEETGCRADPNVTVSAHAVDCLGQAAVIKAQRRCSDGNNSSEYGDLRWGRIIGVVVGGLALIGGGLMHLLRKNPGGATKCDATAVVDAEGATSQINMK